MDRGGGDSIRCPRLVLLTEVIDLTTGDICADHEHLTE